MPDNTVLVADHDTSAWWDGPVLSPRNLGADRLAAHAVAILAPERADFRAPFGRILDWKRAGLLPDTHLFMGTYKGRHLWSPETDALVERWVVHARSEREALESDRLAFVPFCLAPLAEWPRTDDDGTVFMGGRKWRELDIGLEAISRSGLPGRVISDWAPPGPYPGIEIRREMIAQAEYFAAMARARIVAVPLKGTPVSHGHTDVVAAILAGKPLVVTAGASCDDYVEDDVNGLLVPDNSVAAWTAAIRRADAKAEHFAAAARERAPRFRLERYGAYLREMVAFPDRHHVGLPSETGRSDRSEWQRHRAVMAERALTVAHREAFRVADALARERRYAEALTALEPCLDGPLRLRALRSRGSILLRIGDAGAEAAWRALIAEAGEDAESLTNLAAALLARGRAAEALVAARRAVALDPDRIASRTRLIAILRNTGDVEAARGALRDGLALAPGEPTLLRLAEERGDAIS